MKNPAISILISLSIILGGYGCSGRQNNHPDVIKCKPNQSGDTSATDTVSVKDNKESDSAHSSQSSDSSYHSEQPPSSDNSVPATAEKAQNGKHPKKHPCGSDIEKKKLLKKEKMGHAPVPNSPAIKESRSGYNRKKHFNTESYDHIEGNDFKKVRSSPLSTFSIDVDNASYSNVRRFINNQKLPPADAVRIEELINYFDYNYEGPENSDHPFAIHTEASTCPWNADHQLVHIGLQGKRYSWNELPPANLVFLIDVSGSMRSSKKLPLLKKAFRMMVNKLRPQDRVAIVVYAGSSGKVLRSTPGNQKQVIVRSLNQLRAGGSTAGGEGLKLAYQIASENYKEEGINRVMLATDGDFNVGPSSDGEMTRLIEKKRASGISISVLGFGTGNYKDSKMETIADHGNGNYFYIDNSDEAYKALVTEIGGTLRTIAKDVKLQVEFNPAIVKEYRLIGYVNRKLDKEDFNDDTKDAGELGAGHSVTALYQVIPADSEHSKAGNVDTLKYQRNKVSRNAQENDEMLTVKFRYKAPGGSESTLITHPLKQNVKAFEKASSTLRFASAVAGYGMLLRDSEYKGDLTYKKVQSIARSARGTDEHGYRSDFIRMVGKTRLGQPARLGQPCGLLPHHRNLNHFTVYLNNVLAGSGCFSTIGHSVPFGGRL